MFHYNRDDDDVLVFNELHGGWGLCAGVRCVCVCVVRACVRACMRVCVCVCVHAGTLSDGAGKGLGRTEAGLAAAVKVKLKFDKKGVSHHCCLGMRGAWLVAVLAGAARTP